MDADVHFLNVQLALGINSYAIFVVAVQKNRFLVVLKGALPSITVDRTVEAPDYRGVGIGAGSVTGKLLGKGLERYS